MALDHWDAPSGSYTSVIPSGTAAFRKVIAEHFGFTRTEVIRDRSRCNQTRSEHCECGAVDCFTTLFEKGRPFFDWCVKVSEPLGIQSVIFQHREVGFGNPNERNRAKGDHMDHVHVGLTRSTRQNLTEAAVRALLPGAAEEALMVTPDDEKKIRSIVKDELGKAEILLISVTVDGVDRKVGLDWFIKALGQKAGIVDADGNWVG